MLLLLAYKDAEVQIWLGAADSGALLNAAGCVPADSGGRVGSYWCWWCDPHVLGGLDCVQDT